MSNHTYVGEIKYKDVICQGEQEAIIERSVWERVKEIQRSIDPQADHSRRQETIAPLKSILRCGHCGGAMMPTYSNKGGRRYYYYLCCKDKKRTISECPVKQIPAGDIEELVRKQLQKMLSDISLVMRFAEQS
ncbi:MAG: zinc ribbon domain-containing protein, partial [Lentisphaeria bacterium]|nr:zinc ribbon domain-containing protein [Lentisphaeria bacterium]